MKKNIKYVFSILIFVSFNIIAQDIPLFDYDNYNFINKESNYITIFGDSSKINLFYEKLNRLQIKGDNKISILHIGDSHIQADWFSGRLRQRFQQTFPGGNGGPGFVFPYSAATTNGSNSYTVNSTKNWIACRNVQKTKNCALGISGISISTSSATAEFSLKMNIENDLAYDFNSIIVFATSDSNSFEININNFLLTKKIPTSDTTAAFFYIANNYTDNFQFCLKQTDSLQNRFILYGLILQNTDPGIIYQAIGINGAEAESYLNSPRFTPELAIINPDLVIVSLGTNDCYKAGWISADFQNNMSALVDSINKAVPNAAIILTTPPDHYRHKKSINADVNIVKQILFNIADQKNIAIWDLFSVMGGLYSIDYWHNEGLTAKDKIHFNRKGYILQGDIFFNAFLKNYSDYIDL